MDASPSKQDSSALVEAPPAVMSPSCQPNELDRMRIVRALACRKRYRYVSPTVHFVSRGYLIKSPCCSRNIDAEGGIVDIALLLYAQQDRPPWRLYNKEHSRQEWRLQAQYTGLRELLEDLNADPRRLYWQ